MKFYKVIQDKNFIGVASSNSFYRYNTRKHSFVLSNENEGQFIDVNNKLYRDYWMTEVPDYSIQYENAEVIQISEEEYNAIIEANHQEEPQLEQFIPDEQENTTLEPLIYETQVDIDYLKEIIIASLSKACNKTIEAGFDIELRGEIHHFSLNTQDQLNLITLSTLVQTQQLIPYHADGEECIFYTSEEMNQIIQKANSFKIYHTTYYNALKNYVKSLDNAEDVAGIKYGVQIPEEFKTEVLKALE